MWVVVAIQMCVPSTPCFELPLVETGFLQPPAISEEACHIAAYDWIQEWQRRKGMNTPFNVSCRKEGA